MFVSKDIYLHIAKCVDAKTMFSMLSVNKKFKRYFEYIMSIKYPDLISFKKRVSVKEFYLEMLFYICKLTDLPKKTNPKILYLESSKIYYYIGNPKDYDFGNDYDYIKSCRFKEGKIYDIEMHYPEYCSFDLSPDTIIHVFIDKFPYIDDIYKMFHYSKIYRVYDFINICKKKCKSCN